MIPQLPPYVSLVFGLTTLLTGWLFWRAARGSGAAAVVLLGWLVLQAGLGLAHFYQPADRFPPRFPALVVPPLLLLIGLWLTRRGRRFIDHLRPDQLTLLHMVRIPVELVLFWLFVDGAVPQLMTVEGRNFDVLSGLSAPVVYYYGFVKRQLPRGVLIAWNVVCLGLLFNIVIMAALSVPSPFQRLAFERPNIAILYFPFVWLPSVVVPIVLLAHVAVLRQLTRRPSTVYN